MEVKKFSDDFIESDKILKGEKYSIQYFIDESDLNVQKKKFKKAFTILDKFL